MLQVLCTGFIEEIRAHGYFRAALGETQGRSKLNRRMICSEHGQIYGSPFWSGKTGTHTRRKQLHQNALMGRNGKAVCYSSRHVEVMPDALK